MGTGARTSWRRTLDIVGAALCVGVLATTVLVVLAASASVDVQPAAASSVRMLEPGTTSDTGLRDLPILQPDGPVARAFAGGQGLADDAPVEDVARSLAAPYGWGSVIHYLLGVQVQPIDDQHQLDYYHGYPYAYGAIDPIVDSYADDAALRRDPSGVVELASLLLLTAVENDRAFDDYGNRNSHAAVAYSLLRHARDIGNTCEVQLELAFTVAMGFAPHIGDVEREVEEARRLCPDDPTPLWLLGQVEIVQASREPVFFSYEKGSRRLEADAEETFAALRAEFPDSALGWAGAADLRLKQADEGDQLGVQRFENRARRREALRLYEQARARSDDPTLLAGYGWALSGLGRDDEAVAALHEVHDLFPDDPAYRALLVAALRHAGRPEDVVALLHPLLSTDPAPRASLRLTPQTSAVSEPELLSYGARDSVAGWAYDDSQKYSAGSTVLDTGFIPVSNTSWTSTWCPLADLLGAQIQIDDARAAYDVVREKQQIAPSVCPDYPKVLVDRLAGIAAFATGDEGLMRDALTRHNQYGGTATTGRSEIWDDVQDFWRSVGDRDEAGQALDAWRTDLPADPWPEHRAGEVAFLRNDFDAAVTDYRAADDAFRAVKNGGFGEHGYSDSYIGEEEGSADNQLELGAALEQAGHVAQARQAYGQARIQADGQELATASTIDFYVHSQLGGLALAQGDYEAAADEYRACLDGYWGDTAPFRPGDDIYPNKEIGAQDNNLALALVKLGRDDEALQHAESALAHDLANPVYVDTVAFVQQLSGDDDAAIATYQRVLATDPTAYVSANNLAVLLAQDGRRTEAIGLLEKAVAVAPTYAIGWHNLGVLQEPTSTSLLSSQGALARAARLDRGFRGQDGLVVDEEIYRSGLDVSRPLSPDWEYAASATSVSRALSLGTLALLLLRLVWVLGLDRLTGTVSERVIKVSARPGRLRWFWRRLGGPVAVVASLVVLSWPLVTSAHSPLELLVLGAAAAAMVLLPLFVRRLLAGERRVSHFAWVPALVVGAAGVPLGVAFAPYPSLDAPTPSPGSPAPAADTRLRWLVPAAVTPVAATFTLLAALDPVPIARLLALSAIALLASVLTPVPPLDGAYLEHRLLGLGVTVVFTLTTVAFALQWI